MFDDDFMDDMVFLNPDLYDFPDDLKPKGKEFSKKDDDDDDDEDDDWDD